jgi:hypothetical protein
MSTDLELAGQLYADALDYRNRAIIEAHGNGVGLREIGRQAGMTHQGVAKIVAKGRPTDADRLIKALKRHPATRF